MKPHWQHRGTLFFKTFFKTSTEGHTDEVHGQVQVDRASSSRQWCINKPWHLRKFIRCSYLAHSETCGKTNKMFKGTFRIQVSVQYDTSFVKLNVAHLHRKRLLGILYPRSINSSYLWWWDYEWLFFSSIFLHTCQVLYNEYTSFYNHTHYLNLNLIWPKCNCTCVPSCVPFHLIFTWIEDLGLGVLIL